MRTVQRITTGAVAGVVLLALGSMAYAGDSPWYVVASVGESDAEARFGSRHPKRIADDQEAVALAVGYAVRPWLSVEGGYHDLGTHRGFGSPCRESDDACIERLAQLNLCIEGFDCTEVSTNLDADVSGLSLAAVPRWPVTEELSVFGTVGVMAWDSEVEAPSFGRIGDFSGEDLLLGVGLRYDLPSGLGLAAQYAELDLDIRWTSFGLAWRF